MTMNTDNNFKEGDRVTRKNVNAFRYMQGACGTIVKVMGDRCKIKWDEINTTGQQHSTINKKFLNHAE